MRQEVTRVKPSSPGSSSRMARVRQSGTKAELDLRHELFRLGLRYRVNYPVLEKPRRVADIVFPRLRIAVFVDGCFWHGCPLHATWPKQNADFWREKIEKNRERDGDTDRRLRADGWEVIRIWEHESPSEAAFRVKRSVSARKKKTDVLNGSAKRPSNVRGGYR